MKKDRCFVAMLIAGVVQANPGVSTAFSAQLDPQTVERWADEQVASVVRSGGATAAAAVVVSRGEVLLARSYGWFDPVKRIPVRSEDQFLIGSITKSFVSLVIARLQLEGRIESLGDPANQYLKRCQLPNAFGKAVTIEQLATHTAGFESPSYGLSIGNQKDIPASGEELRRRLPKIVRPPGFKVVYANFGPPVLGAIAEDVTGERLDRIMDERLLRPLGMHDTVLGYDATGGGHLVYAGIREGDRVRHAQRMLNDPVTAPSGSIRTTPDDMARYMNALLGHAPAVLPQKLLETQRKPRAVNYPGLSPVGLGVFLDPWNGTTLVNHGGLIAGFRSNMVVVPANDFGVFVVYAGGTDLFNGGPGNAGAATDELIKSVLGPVVPLPPKHSSDVKSLEGKYWLELRGHTTPEAITGAARMVEVTAAAGDLLIGTGPSRQRFIEVAPGLFQGPAEHGGRPALYGFEAGRILANKMYGVRVSGLHDPKTQLWVALVALALMLSGSIASFTGGPGRLARLSCSFSAIIIVCVFVWPLMRGLNLDVELFEGHDWRFRVMTAAAWLSLAAAIGCILQAVHYARAKPTQSRSLLATAHCALVGLAGLVFVGIAHAFHVL